MPIKLKMIAKLISENRVGGEEGLEPLAAPLCIRPWQFRTKYNVFTRKRNCGHILPQYKLLQHTATEI